MTSPVHEFAELLHRKVIRDCSPVYHALNQSEQWVDRLGQAHRLTTMDPVYRFVAAKHMLRRARRYETRYTLGEALAGEYQMERADQRKIDCEGWIRQTPLYQALMRDLPADTAMLAHHWSKCPVRADRAGLDRCACHRAYCMVLNDGEECTCRGNQQPNTHIL